MAEHEKNPGTIFPTADAEYGLTGDSLRRDQIEGGGVGTAPEPRDGMRRYPTEEPTSRTAGTARRRTMAWSAAGAFAGAAAAFLGMRLARRR